MTDIIEEIKKDETIMKQIEDEAKMDAMLRKTLQKPVSAMILGNMHP